MELSLLNPKQREAVTHTQGPLLVLAGAGSGKTTVLVNRIAYIIEHEHVSPFNILAITFTNKAAREMYDRVLQIMGDMAEDMWISTFHSACVKILRRTIHLLGYDNDFVIYDSQDTATLIKECLKELNMDEKLFPKKLVSSVISKAKDNMQDVDAFRTLNSKNYFNLKVAEVYELYQRKLKRNNALDFDDIVLNTVKIFMENPDILENYQKRFKYILVDEYQDTNNVQYMLISLLAQGSRNICVVGDDDQSIYKFRGANIQNILGFEDEFGDACVIKLEQNYRSTQNILDTANRVIANNRGRKPKALWTDNDRGEMVKIFTAENEYDEGRFIAEQIEQLVREGGKYSDAAILYRTNSQSRAIEDQLMRNAVPYKVLAGLRFYDRKEIKDIIAYLRVIHNQNDSVSLKRIINEPKRGIGAATVEKAEELAELQNVSVYDVIKNADAYDVLSRSAAKLSAFCQIIEALKKAEDGMTVTEFAARVLRDSGYSAALEREDTVEARTRLENLQEFMSVTAEYEKENPDSALGGFLEEISLVADIDNYDEDQDCVVMMTIHSAKGLEFPTVFLTGMEEGLFPSARSESEDDIEEERRLCYVAITRAKNRLYITNTERRTIFGKTTANRQSRFLKEVPMEYTEDLSRKRTKIQQGISNGIAERMQKERERMNRQTAAGGDVPKQQSFAPGDIVMHKKFGRGIVVEAQAFGKDMRLAVSFDSVGMKQLMAAFARLEKLEEDGD